MGATAFTRNHRDHSNDTGYQFEFFCDKCGNGYRSTFQASALGVGSKIAKGLGALFGGNKLWGAGVAADHLKDGLRGQGWDDAFKKAIDEIKPKFHQCTRCGIWVCPEVCWNAERGMCENCAPDLAEEAASAQAHIAADQAKEKLRSVDQVKGFDPNAQYGIAGQCPGCSTKLAPGAKFCAGCGKPVAAPGISNAKVFCTGCGTQLPPGSKFCSGCGTATGT
jgi:double zinc ribbon protein